MILEKCLPKSQGSHKKIYVKCDQCEKIYETEYRYVFRYRQKRNSKEDYCWYCSLKNVVSSSEHREKMSKIQQKIQKSPTINLKRSRTMKQNKVNVGNKNGMKKKENKMKVSETRKLMFKNGKLSREKISQKTRQAWLDGKFEGVNVGQCKWFKYEKFNGEIIKCQGTWELEFAKWLDSQRFLFETHKGKIKYEDNEGKVKFYYPDFFVHQWNSFVDVKNDYHWNLQKQKFNNIKRSNPNLNLRILLKRDLIDLGVLQ